MKLVLRTMTADATAEAADTRCTVCMSLFRVGEEVVVTECGHLYHHVCIDRWFQQEESCPNCKRRVDRSHVIDERASLTANQRHSEGRSRVHAQGHDDGARGGERPEDRQRPQAMFFTGPGSRGSRKTDVMNVLALEGKLIRAILPAAGSELECGLSSRLPGRPEGAAPADPGAVPRLRPDLSRAERPVPGGRVPGDRPPASLLARERRLGQGGPELRPERKVTRS
jgi:hypothetical protein